jgi:uncharacterized membrane protein
MMRGWDYGYDVMGGNWVAALLTAFFGALIVAGLIVLVIWAIRAASGHGGHRYATHGGYGGHGRYDDRSEGGGFDFLGPRSGQADDAVEIARRRFAAGEITREQYDEILNALNR